MQQDEKLEGIAQLVSPATTPNPLNGLNGLTAARRKFGAHFLTFWHLVHLATVENTTPEVGVSWAVTSCAGVEWRASINYDDHLIFDAKLVKNLSFMESKIFLAGEKTLSEKSVDIIENYDKCLDAIMVIQDQMKVDGVNIAKVCAKILEFYNRALESFKLLPILWNHLFICRIHQLLLLAKDCYPVVSSSNSNNNGGGQLATIDNWITAHADHAAKLCEHFSKPQTNLDVSAISVSSTVSINSKLFQPTVQLDALIATLSRNAKCAAEQIPTAVTSIVHEYSYLDPFNPVDMEFVKMKVVELHNAVKIDKIE